MIIKEIYTYREMLRNLIHRDLRGRYKGSALGFLWTFINPLLQLVVYTVVFSNIIKIGVDDYHLFLFVALIPWLFFCTSISSGSNCIWNEKNLVTKIYFPREILPLAVVTSNFINMLYGFIIILLVCFFFGKDVNVVVWLYLPLIFAIEYVWTLGLTLIFSALMVYFRDLEHILGIVTMVWQFLCPIMYPVSMVPESYLRLYDLNPMVTIIIAYRDILYYGKAPEIGTLVLTTIFGMIVLFLGFYIFGKLKRRFAEEL